MNPIRILIADDHTVVRAGLRGLLAGQPDFDVVGEAQDGAEAVTQTTDLTPDVVLMDLRMPGVDGVSAIRQIKAQHPDTHILVLTTYDSDTDIVPAIEAGATGYLLKDAPAETLYQAIRATARGESVLAPTVAARLMGRMRAPAQENLSPREIQVMTWVMKGLGKKEIAHELHISKATVKTHLIHIYGKLGVDNRTSAVAEALKRGVLRLEE